MGGRHKAPSRHRKKPGRRLLGALRPHPGPGTETAPPPHDPTAPPPSYGPAGAAFPPGPPAAAPATDQLPGRPTAPTPAGAADAGPSGDDRASWWLLAQAGCLAFVVAVVGLVLTWLDIIVDGRESLVGSGLLLAPVLVRQIVLGVRRRWLALAIAYAALAAVGAGTLIGADFVLVHTVAGFTSAALGVLAGGAAFVLTSRLFRQRAAAPADATGPAWQAPAAPPWTAAPPAVASHDAGTDSTAVLAAGEVDDEPETDTLPQVLPSSSDRRDDDSLAG